jgi:2-methylisocitrate lyase-like PEP mutase family enzyme
MNMMDRERQLHLAEDFRTRHRTPHLLLLANAWDALSARIVEEAGFDAVATTSGGVNWVLGYADGEAAPWSEVVAATARMVRVLRVPLTADIEAGYGGTQAEVAKSVGEIIAAGAVGINLEDGTGREDAPILGIDEAASRIRAARNAAREAAVPIVINARIDIYLKQIGIRRRALPRRCDAPRLIWRRGPIASSPLPSPTLTRSAD